MRTERSLNTLSLVQRGHDASLLVVSRWLRAHAHRGPICLEHDSEVCWSKKKPTYDSSCLALTRAWRFQQDMVPGSCHPTQASVLRSVSRPLPLLGFGFCFVGLTTHRRSDISRFESVNETSERFEASHTKLLTQLNAGVPPPGSGSGWFCQSAGTSVRIALTSVR